MSATLPSRAARANLATMISHCGSSSAAGSLPSGVFAQDAEPVGKDLPLECGQDFGQPRCWRGNHISPALYQCPHDCRGLEKNNQPCGMIITGA